MLQLGRDPRTGSAQPGDLEFHRLLEALPAGAYTCDADGLITYFNPRAVEVWGRAPALNDPVDRFCGSFKLFTPDGTPLAHDHCWMGLALRDGKEYNGCEVVVERPDGTRRTVLAHANPFFDEAGRVRGAVNVLVDITRRKRDEEAVRHSERELADFFDNAPVAMHWVGGDGRIVRVNRAELDLLGYSAGEMVGRPIADFHADPSAISDILCRLKAGDQLTNYPARLRCKDGSVRHVLIDSNVKWDGDRFAHTRCFTRDITDQKRAEETVRFVADGGADYTCVARFTGQRVVLESASEGFARVTGYTVEEFNQMALGLPVHPDDMLGLVEGLDRLLRGETVTGEARVVTKAGDVRWLRYLAQSSPDPDSPWGFRIHGVAQDITGRKEARDRVEEAERRFRQMAEGIQEVFWLTDPMRTQVLYCSPAYEQVWGRSCESLYREPWSLLDAVVPEDLERFTAALERQARGEPTDVEYRITRPDGSVRWVRDRGFPVKGPAGEVVRVAGVADDITDRKRVENEIRHVNHTLTTLVRSAPLPVVVIDPDPPLVRLWNPAAERVFGWAEAEVLGRPLPIVPDDKLDEFRSYRAAVVAGRTFDGMETARRRKDGTRVEISLSAAPLKDGGGATTGLLLMFTDITERIRAEEAVREADRRKTEFLAMLAHELRNPLAPIRNGLQVLRLAGSDPAVAGRAREMMDRQLGHMVRLIDDLLDLSRITKGKIELRRDRIELAAAVQDAVESCRPLIHAAGHELTVTLPPAPVYLDADRTRLAQVFANLLNNSAKYTARGGHIRLAAERQGSDAVVSVADDGAGIPADVLPRVFEMFTQADRSLERTQGGLGIGLSLVKGLVEMHGGSVSARSDGPGKGSEFVVRLPVALAPARESDADRPNGEARSPARRILVVDDNEDAAVSLAMMLQIMGHLTRTAHDGESGLAAAAEFRPDVVLLDIGLPGLNGFEVCRHIREQSWGAGTVLIALTGWGQDEDRRRSKEAGFNFHMVKPVDPAALTKLLSGLLLTPA